MIALIILSSFLAISFYAIFNLLRKIERYEDLVWKQDFLIGGITEVVKDSQVKLKELDSIGAFESDDEVGYFFNQLKQIQEILNKFTVRLDGKN